MQVRVRGEPVEPRTRRRYTGRVNDSANPFQAEVAQLEERVQRVLAAYQQARLEKRRMIQERDRLQAINAELRKRIEGVIDRIKHIEAASA